MSTKRSRATYEAELQAQQSPFVVFGTPLPPLDPEVRDDGSYVPVWKQEVRDERGRKRLHGAFTGGFSAGYFNTVGSKEGWTPQTFVSSRTNRWKDRKDAARQKPEDFMDEEDLAEAEESSNLQTKDAFAAFGSTQDDSIRLTGLAGLFRPEGETMGIQLLKRMGWKDGQGIGPKVLRKAQLNVGPGSATDVAQEYHLFAPENVVMIQFEHKTDHKGLGFSGTAKLEPLKPASLEDRAGESEEDEEDVIGPAKAVSLFSRKKKEKKRSGIGFGVLNDTGSDDEDPYEMGPRISYNRVIGGEKKKKKKESSATTSANPLIKLKPVFISKKNGLAKVGLGARKCHDGRLPLDGFIFGRLQDALIAEVNTAGKYAPPEVPPDWATSRQPTAARGEAYVSTADAAKASKLDPKSRADLLGEKQLPGKSVFDFLSTSARDRLVRVTGNKNLPEARGEIPAEYAISAEERLAELLKDVPTLDKATAVAAIARGASGGAPYADNEAKRSRYRAYLEYQAGLAPSLPPRPTGMKDDDWLREFHEFFNCARIFKPMSGFMASRFTTSTSSTKPPISSSNEGTALVSRPPPKPSDPAEEAAKMGMYGPMTRSVQYFYPARLLCKRFNVKPPALVEPDVDMGSSGAPNQPSRSDRHGYGGNTGLYVQDNVPLQKIEAGSVPKSHETAARSGPPADGKVTSSVVDPGRNAALEEARAGEEVFKAIFGEDSDDE